MTEESDTKRFEIVVDGVKQFGSFLKEVFGESLENVGEISKYHTEYWKLANGLKVRDKVHKLLREKGIKNDQVAKLRIGVPLIEEAVKEDDDGLQDLWAGLLASAISEKSKYDSKKMYIDILKQIDPADAKLLEVLYVVWTNWQFSENKDVLASVRTLTEQFDAWVSIRNLERLGLVRLLDAKRRDCSTLILLDDDPKFSNQTHIKFEFTTIGQQFYESATGRSLTTADGEHRVVAIDNDDYFTRKEKSDSL